MYTFGINLVEEDIKGIDNISYQIENKKIVCLHKGKK